MERSGCQRKNNVFAFHADAEIKDQEKKWCLITPLQGGVWKAGGTWAPVTVPFWKQGEGPEDQWPLLMHVLVVAKWPSQPPQLGPGSLRGGGSGARVHPALAPETASGKCQTGL